MFLKSYSIGHSNKSPRLRELSILTTADGDMHIWSGVYNNWLIYSNYAFTDIDLKICKDMIDQQIHFLHKAKGVTDYGLTNGWLRKEHLKIFEYSDIFPQITTTTSTLYI